MEQLKEVGTPPKKKSWWQVKGKGLRNLKPIKDAFSSHEFTLRAYGISITSFDVEAINSLLGDTRSSSDKFRRRVWNAVHYYVNALVKLDKEKRGLAVEWDMEGCRDFEDYVELAQEKWATIEEAKKEVMESNECERSDNERPDTREVNRGMLRLETHRPSGLETQGVTLHKAQEG